MIQIKDYARINAKLMSQGFEPTCGDAMYTLARAWQTAEDAGLGQDCLLIIDEMVWDEDSIKLLKEDTTVTKIYYHVELSCTTNILTELIQMGWVAETTGSYTDPLDDETVECPVLTRKK